MKEIILEKRYPHSREEDITDAFMRGYEIGKEQEHRWWSTFCANCKDENSSEKPNNCEVKNYCDDCLYTDTCDSKEFFYACTSKATISKMEQVDEPKCIKCKHFNRGRTILENGHFRTYMECMASECTYEPKDEPQTETEIAKAIVHKMIDDAVIAEDAYPDLRQKMHDAVDEYEPQTERRE